MLSTLPPLRVLILEDNEDDYELDLSYLRENFVPVGTRIYTAADFRRELSEGAWDIILCDFNMPQFTAFDALEILRDSGLDIPCIIVSGSVSEETAVRCIKAGAQDYLVKDRLLKLPLVVERELNEAALRAERKSVELALQESNRDVQNFRAALEAIAIVSVTDLKGDILYVNEAFLAISQYSATEVIGQNHRLLNSGTHPQEFFTTMWLTISSGKPWRDEICNRAKDGSLYWVDSIISPMFDEHGHIYQYMSSRYDITERKKAEDALRRSEEYLQTIIDTEPECVKVVDTQGNLLAMNPAGLAMLEVQSLHEAQETSLSDFLLPEYRYAFTTLHKQVMSGESGKLQYELQGLKGTRLWLETQAVPLRDTATGKVTKLLGITRDITERKKAENDLAALNRTLELRVEDRTRELTVLNNEKNEFLGIAAHDLKNPLSGILSSAEILERYFADDDKILRFVRMVIGASEQMMEIIGKLLDVNKLESGLTIINIKPISLAVVAPVVEDYQQRAGQKGILLLYTSSPDAAMPVVLADEQALWQVLDNLISNAVKYSPPWKNIWVRVLSRTDADGRSFGRVEIQDEGPGISDADQQKLFGKFMRLTAQTTGGENSTGLGLSIVKKLVELQQGQVWCESELGKGATFIVEFPCA